MAVTTTPHTARICLLTRSRAALTGMLALGRLRLPCAIGRGGIRALKREGDGATPHGRHRAVRVLYRRRPGRIACRPWTALPISNIEPADGWCDAVGDRNYNRRVRHPYPASAERLWRDDGLYDLIVVLNYNCRPRVQAHGSAIFIHVARPGFTPTEGCIALTRRDLMRLLACVTAAATVDVGMHGGRSRRRMWP